MANTSSSLQTSYREPIWVTVNNKVFLSYNNNILKNYVNSNISPGTGVKTVNELEILAHNYN
ncbi:MAG: hypothetical protein HOD92_15110 [Deltaproteobacteria bacterium]|nr:hypothetical protein [Deltaproteobacteria bacterium]